MLFASDLNFMSFTPATVRRKRKTPHGRLPSALRVGGSARKMARRPLSAIQNDRAAQERPSLTSLPVELLELILFFSLNLCLPHASPIIGAKLSGRATLIRLFVSAFHDTWNSHFGIPVRSIGSSYPRRRQASYEMYGGLDEDHQIQSDVLNQPWVTIDLVLQAEQFWVGNWARNRWYSHAPGWTRVCPDEQHFFDENGFGHFNSRECFDVEYKHMLRQPPSRFFCRGQQDYQMHGFCFQTRLPPRLLTCEWSEDTRRLAFWFWRNCICGFGSVPWEDKIAFLRNAVIDATEPEVVVYYLLRAAWLFSGIPRTDAWRALRTDLGKRLQWGDDSSEVRIVLKDIQHKLDGFSYQAA